jgi:hypothetical protein
MSVSLADFVPSLLREIQPPGAETYNDVSEDEMIGYLVDGFWEASLDGFVNEWTCDEDGLVVPLALGGEDLPRAQVTLIILYAGIRMLRNKILNMNTSFSAKAGPVEFEQQSGASVLQEMLRQLKSTKDRLLSQAEFTGSLDLAIDALSVRSYSGLSYWGGPELMGY